LAARLGVAPEAITGVAVAEAARAGDAQAEAILVEVGGWLGIGIGNLINCFDPEMVVIGGGAAGSMGLVLERIRESAAATAVDPRSADTPIVISELGNEAALLGAAALVFESHRSPG
jgi:glucokinase